MKREDFLKQLLETFRAEGVEHTQRLTEGLLALEKETDAVRRTEEIEVIYREAHSLKGAARAVGLRDVEIICQAMESVLSGCKRGELALTRPLLNLLHDANDLTARVITTPGDPAPADLDRIERTIKTLENAAAGLEFPDAPPSCATTPQGDQIASPQAEASPSATETVQPQSTGLESAPPLQIDTPHHTEVMSPPSAPTAPADSTTPAASAGPVAPSPRPAEPAGSSPPSTPPPPVSRAQTIRVNTTLLENLLHQSEDLVGLRQRLEHRTSKVAELHGSIHDWRGQWKKQGPACRAFRKWLATQLAQESANSSSRLMQDLLDRLEEQQQRLNWMESQTRELKFQADQDIRTLGLLIESLRDGMHHVLMRPFSHLLAGFPKMVHDLARDLDKQVDFTIQGDEAQVDRRILEELKDPLLHLVRNALDHGLETPEERRKAMKPETGCLRLAISQVGGGKLELTLADDGRGLDPGKLCQEAIRRKLLSAEQAGQLSEEQSIELIFHSGFSTSARVSELSGRGLGMAIVREKIAALGGDLRLESRPGQGATFRMLLPASISTTRGILVQAGGRIFCLPTSGVEHVLRFRKESLARTQGVPTVNWQGQVLSFIPLASLLGLAEEPRALADDRNFIALLIGHGGQRLALGVERILSEQELVVKGLGAGIRRLRNIAGTTVLGTGELVPILHFPDLLQTAHHLFGPDSCAMPAAGETPAVRRILVADDSITTRMLLKNILEAAGHQVTAVADGAQALELLRNAEFDLLISDIEMPSLGGLQLCQALRADPRWLNLPVILCTSLESEADRRRGLECGANAYLVKRDLQHGQLLELVDQLT